MSDDIIFHAQEAKTTFVGTDGKVTKPPRLIPEPVGVVFFAQEAKTYDLTPASEAISSTTEVKDDALPASKDPDSL